MRTHRSRSLFQLLVEALRGRRQMMVRAGDDLPLLLLSFPSAAHEVAREVEAAYAHTLRRLSPEARGLYRELFDSAPAMIVLVLRPLNPCQCLGHYHPAGAESRLTRRLEADLGERIGEIDLAYEGIREWRPEPLSTLAAGDLGGRFPAIHFQAALLAVLLHELEHLVFPEKAEQEVRLKSNRFYSTAMQELVAEESGADYGMASPPPPRP
jgi:hypothetical protein